MGVKPQTDATRLVVLQLLAEYLTDETRQMERFDALSWGPANLNAQKSEAVQSNPGLAALLQQNEYSVPQGQIHGSWWDIAKVIADDVKAATDEAGLQAALDNYYNKISALFTMTEDEKEAWSVIGAICGTNWDTDFPMTETEANVFVSDTLELKAGNEFKVRQGASWTVNYGADCAPDGANIKVEADGNYTVKLDLNNMTLELLDESGAAVEAEPTPEPDPNAVHTWALIGTVADTNWDTDIPMFEKEDGLFRVVAVLTTENEFKVRADADWALNYGITEGATVAGGDNVKVEEDGTYLITLDPNEEAPALTVEKITWTVIGGFEASGWANDIAMTETETGLWVSEPFAMKAGDEYKVRANADWTVNFGITDDVLAQDGGNVKVEADGNYVVTLDLNNMTLAAAAE